MPIFVLVVFGILGDVEGFPLPLKRTKSLPLRQIIIARFFFLQTIIVTRYFSPSDNFPEKKGTSFVTHGNVLFVFLKNVGYIYSFLLVFFLCHYSYYVYYCEHIYIGI